MKIGTYPTSRKKREFEDRLRSLAETTQPPVVKMIADLDPSDEKSFDGGFWALIDWYRNLVGEDYPAFANGVSLNDDMGLEGPTYHVPFIPEDKPELSPRAVIPPGAASIHAINAKQGRIEWKVDAWECDYFSDYLDEGDGPLIDCYQWFTDITDHPALRDWCLDGERLTLENIAGLFQEWDQSNSNPSFNASKLFLMTDPRDSGTPIVW